MQLLVQKDIQNGNVASGFLVLYKKRLKKDFGKILVFAKQNKFFFQKQLILESFKMQHKKINFNVNET